MGTSCCAATTRVNFSIVIHLASTFILVFFFSSAIHYILITGYYAGAFQPLLLPVEMAGCELEGR